METDNHPEKLDGEETKRPVNIQDPIPFSPVNSNMTVIVIGGSDRQAFAGLGKEQLKKGHNRSSAKDANEFPASLVTSRSEEINCRLLPTGSERTQ